MANSGSQQGPWWASLVAGFAIIVVGIVAVIFLARATFSFLTAAPTDVGSAVVGAGSLVFVAVIANIWAKLFERRQQIQQEQRTKKAEIYDGLLSFWFGFYLRDDKDESTEEAGTAEKATGRSATDEEVNNYLTEFTHQIVTWGSEPVLKEYAAFTDKIKGGGALLEFENLLFAIRKDLGHKNKGLQQGDIMRVFINSEDVDPYIQKRKLNSG